MLHIKEPLLTKLEQTTAPAVNYFLRDDYYLRFGAMTEFDLLRSPTIGPRAREAVAKSATSGLR